MELLTLREWDVISDFFRDEAREARKAARRSR
jgi:hypothetical protein